MKIRTDYVTNSSSSSYIICFARITDKEKAYKIIEEYNLNVFTKQGVEGEMSWSGYLGADWAGAILWNAEDILKAHPKDEFIIIEDYIDADWDEESEECIYYYDFSANNAIDEITEENGFADIECAEGEGRNG